MKKAHKATLSFKKRTDLLRNVLYTVVLKDTDTHLGVFPDDQGFNKKSVFLWDNPEDLIRFSDEKFKIISITIPQFIKYSRLKRLVGSAYSLPYISNKWNIKELHSLPLYIQ